MLIQAEFPMFGGRIGCDVAGFACDKNAVYFQDCPGPPGAVKHP
jgi:hypothetical protein